MALADQVVQRDDEQRLVAVDVCLVAAADQVDAVGIGRHPVLVDREREHALDVDERGLGQGVRGLQPGQLDDLLRDLGEPLGLFGGAASRTS